MLRNYLKIAWRNFKRETSYSLINTVGLSVAITAFILIALFIHNEWSYDRYHKDADKLYRITKKYESDKLSNRTLATSYLLAPTLEREVAGIKETVRIQLKSSEKLVKTEKQIAYEEDVLTAESTIFDLFNFKFIEGNPETALTRPNTVVITESAARKYFGDKNPIGKSVSITSQFEKVIEYEVTGLLENIPSNTHFSFEFLTSLETIKQKSASDDGTFGNWNYMGAYTYLKLKEGVDSETVEAQFPQFLSKHQKERAKNRSMNLQPVTDIHLYSDFRRELGSNSNVEYLYIFGCVALLILIIASINYTNLAIARSSERAREVGIHKALGVTRLQLIYRFVTESILFSFIAVLLSIGLTELTLPYFKSLIGLDLALFKYPLVIMMLLLLFTVIFGSINGFYPAIILSKYKPGKVFSQESSGRKKSYIRRGLIVLQFSGSAILILLTLVINDQLDYIKNKQLGFNADKIVKVRAGDGLNSSFSVFNEKLIQYPEIEKVTYSGHTIPAKNLFSMCLHPEGQPRITKTLYVGPDFIQTMGINLLKGQNIDGLSVSRKDDFLPILINESAVKVFGWEDKPIGKKFECFSPSPTVVGVIENFHFESLKKKIEPLVLMGAGAAPRYAFIRVKADSIQSTINKIKKVWRQVGPETAFRYSFLENDYKNLYRGEDKLASLFGNFTLLAIIIACMGLYGLSAYTISRRTKEVGIRKALGASVINIVTILSKQFIKLITISLLIALPIAFYLSKQWLQDFAYKVEMNSYHFILTVGLILLVTVATISWHSIRAALMDPADSIRNE